MGKNNITTQVFEQQMKAAWTPYNALCIPTVSGIVQPPLLAKVLNMLQKRHPFLRVSMDNWPDTIFVEKNIQAIPLKHSTATNKAELNTIIQQELLYKYHDLSLPLMRVHLVHLAYLDNVYAILINIHHRITDGASLLNVTKELLETYEALSNGNKEYSLAILTERYDDITVLFPKRFFTFWGKWKTRFIFFNTVISEIRQLTKHKPTSLFPVQFVKQEQVNIGLTQCKFSSSMLAKALEVSRANGTSLHGSCCAALLKAAYEYYSKKNNTQAATNFICLSPINLRPYLNPPLKAFHFGNPISASRTKCIMQPNKDFWEIARQVKQDIRHNISADLIFIYRLYARVVAKAAMKAKKFNPPVLSVSNLGRIQLKEQYANLQLQRLYYYVTNKGLVNPNIAVVVSTFNNELYWDINYPAHFITVQDMNTIIGRAKEIFINQINQ